MHGQSLPRGLEKRRIHRLVAATFVRRQNKCEMIDPQLPSRSIMIMTARARGTGRGREAEVIRKSHHRDNRLRR